MAKKNIADKYWIYGEDANSCQKLISALCRSKPLYYPC